jgi:hypothetical protein
LGFVEAEKKLPENLKSYTGHVSLAFLIMGKYYSSRIYDSRRGEERILSFKSSRNKNPAMSLKM